ncbi:50S ribosomal protein L9 [bacterium HR34]|nr:50S ribosomal protein L9 [bacterium HR34]
MKVKVILLKRVEGLGNKGDIKEVSVGYAQNYLIPKGLVKIADEKTIKELEKTKKQKEIKAEKELLKIQEMVEKIDCIEVEMPAKVGKNGRLYESINAKKIMNKLSEMGYNTKYFKVKLEKPIKEVGEYDITLKFKHNLEAKIRLIVVEDIL